jgi:hypothetical protein
MLRLVRLLTVFAVFVPLPAQAVCVAWAGTQSVSFEQRENKTGRPGKLVERKTIQKSFDGDTRWCVTNDSITYIEPAGSGGPAIDVTFPFGGGTVTKQITSNSLPVFMTGNASRSGNDYTIFFQYTIGAKLTEAVYAERGSTRYELNARFRLDDTGCSLLSIDTMWLNNSGRRQGKHPSVTLHGYYTGWTTKKANATCKVVD